MTDYELEAARKARKKELAFWLMDVDEQTVDVNGVVFHAGYDSGMRLDAAKRLAELAGLTECTFTDTSNVPHTYSIADAAYVVLMIASHYQTAFQQKQVWSVEIKNATTIAELPVIVWPIVT